MKKISIYYFLIFIIIMVFLMAYIDVIRIGTYSYQQYLAICLWEAGILLVGVIFGNKFITFQKSTDESKYVEEK